MDKWVQREASLRLVALRSSGRMFSTMENGWEIQLNWDPKLEANPKRRKGDRWMGEITRGSRRSR